MKTILFIRHGENDSIGKYLPGRKPGLHLNATGRQQAEMVAESLAHAGLNRIISSPLERATDTAEPLARRLGLQIEINQGFIEMDPGDWSGRTFEDLKNDPGWANLRVNPTEYAYPNGETFAATSGRVWAALMEVVEREPADSTVAIFSHADCIRLMLGRAIGLPLDRFTSLMIDTASLSILKFHRNHLIMHGQNIRLPYSWQP